MVNPKRYLNDLIRKIRIALIAKNGELEIRLSSVEAVSVSSMDCPADFSPA